MVQRIGPGRPDAVHRKVASELGQHLAAGAARGGGRIRVRDDHRPHGTAGRPPRPRRRPPRARRRWSGRTTRSRRCSRRTRGRPPPRARSPRGTASTAHRRGAAPRAPPPAAYQSLQTSGRNEVPAASGGTPRKSATVWPMSANVRRRPSATGRTAGPSTSTRHHLARVIGGRRRRVVAVIGGKDNEVVLRALAASSRGSARSSATQPAVESGHVVPVAPGLVELDHVGQQEPAVHRLEARPRSARRPRRWSRCGCWRCPGRRTGRPPCRPRPGARDARPAGRAASGPAAAG